MTTRIITLTDQERLEMTYDLTQKDRLVGWTHNAVYMTERDVMRKILASEAVTRNEAAVIGYDLHWMYN